MATEVTGASANLARAQTLFEQGKEQLEKKAYSAANTFFHQSLQLFKELPGETSHPQVIYCYERLATIAHAEGKVPEMAAYAQAALSPCQKKEKVDLNDSN